MCVRVREVWRSLQSTSQDGKGRPLWGDSTAVLSKSFLSSPLYTVYYSPHPFVLHTTAAQHKTNLGRTANRTRPRPNPTGPRTWTTKTSTSTTTMTTRRRRREWSAPPPPPTVAAAAARRSRRRSGLHALLLQLLLLHLVEQGRPRTEKGRCRCQSSVGSQTIVYSSACVTTCKGGRVRRRAKYQNSHNLSICSIFLHIALANNNLAFPISLAFKYLEKASCVPTNLPILSSPRPIKPTAAAAQLKYTLHKGQDNSNTNHQKFPKAIIHLEKVRLISSQCVCCTTHFKNYSFLLTPKAFEVCPTYIV